MTVEYGSIFRCNHEPRHIWVVLSDPQLNDGQILLVNFTTLREKSVDEECILRPSDYSLYLTQETTVAYSRAKCGSVEKMKDAIKKGYFTPLEPISKDVLTKIRDGALRSPELAPKKQSLVKADS